MQYEREDIQYANFQKIVIDWQILFQTHYRGQYFICDKETGELRAMETYVRNHPRLESLNLRGKPYSQAPLELSPRLNIDYEAKRISVRGGRHE